MRAILYVSFLAAALAACSATENPVTSDFGFDGTCVNCHLGLSAAHVHPNFKLRCIDCHGGNDQVAVPADATDVGSGGDPTATGKFRDQALLKQAHVVVKDPKLARFFYANGIDDDGDGMIDEPFLPLDGNPADGQNGKTNATKADLGEVFEPSLHGEGGGEFLDAEYNRDLNYTRWLNPGDLRVATIGCGSRNRAALDGGGGGSCHQETVDVVRRSIMVNQAAVTNGAYYGNESWRDAFIAARGNTPDPRAGAFGYQLDYDTADACIDVTGTKNDPTGRGQPSFDHKCAEQNAVKDNPLVDTGKPGNMNLPPFEITQGTLKPPNGMAVDKDGNPIDPGVVSDPATTLAQTVGAGQSRYPWGGTTIFDQTAERAQFQAIPSTDLVADIPDPVDVILRTFRAYYPVNFIASTTNFNFTFGTSILPDINTFKTDDPYGRGHSSGCSACHAAYNYDGSRNPTQVVCNGDDDTKIACQGKDDGTVVAVTDPTTKHREFDASLDVPVTDPADPMGQVLFGRTVFGAEQVINQRPQQKNYSADHTMTTAITTDQCGLCHGFVTRINYAYQGMGEEEQRDQLSRRQTQAFTTPNGTSVLILDSWVRVQKDQNGHNQVIQPAGLAVIKNAKARDAALLAAGFVPGNGGCAQSQFTEDCNNNGELDHNVTLQKLDEDGNVVATATLDEDGMLTLPDGTTVMAGNGNGKLDLVDRLPRENSVDGRQVRYVYGGRNGSAHEMDIHFEKGMACIDCHFLQDVHGDGHIYSTNWDHIEVECEDCHGTGKTRATLKTSGPTGGNDLTTAHDANLVPYFQNKGGKIIQRSRVVPGLFWIVPQTIDQTDALSQEAHVNQPHVAEAGQGSTFADPSKPPGQSKLTAATIECAACHSSWVHNCTGCHVNSNSGDAQRVTTDVDGNLGGFKKDHTGAQENEIWFGNTPADGHIDFQLLGLMRSTFVLGVSSSSEIGRLATFRSSMEAMASLTNDNSDEIAENVSFTTFQAVDGNSGRMNVATSGVAMNQTMPHTVRPHEARGCEMCHSLVDPQTMQSRNDHILAETYGLGTGALDITGDWAMAAGVGGIELYDYKQNNELAANGTRVNATNHSTFPGLIVNAKDRLAADVEPVFGGGGITAGDTASDITMIRNFNATPAMAGATQPPTLRDLAVVSVLGAAGGKLLIADVSQRGVPGARSATSDVTKEFVLSLSGQPNAVAHLAPDVSDPFVYVAVGTAGVDVVRIDDAPSATGAAATLVTNVPLNGRNATEVELAGDVLYVGTDDGTVEVLDLSNPSAPVFQQSASVDVGATVHGLAASGFILYGVTDNGLIALDLQNPLQPVQLIGAQSITVAQFTGGNELSVAGGHAYVADGTGGVLDFDVRTPAAPKANGNVMTDAALAGINASDVVVSTMPGQLWLVILDRVTGDLGLQKLDNTKSTRDRCWPNPAQEGCTLDLSFLDLAQSGRDPSFDPNTGLFDAADPSSKSARMTHTILSGGGRRLARPAQWEAINTLTGRRYRDSFMPGSSTLSADVMQTMRSVQVCETTDTSSRAPGNLNALGYPDGSGGCKELTPGALPSIRKRPKAVCAPEPGETVCRPAGQKAALKFPIDVSPIGRTEARRTMLSGH